ncbi:MAG: HtaA domain-containing protein [Mycetocola sp.]
MSATQPRAGMLWAVKRSFQNYVAALPDARRSVTGGAMVTADQEFLFSLVADGSDARLDPGSRVRFGGDVRFSGHDGMLFVVVADPEIRVSSDGSAVVGVDTFVPGVPGIQNIDLVTLTLNPPERSNGYLIWADLPACLTEAGAELFNGVYAAGDALDPVSVLLPAPSFAAS